MGLVVGWLGILALVYVCLRDVGRQMKGGGCSGCTVGCMGSCSGSCQGGCKVMFKTTLEVEGMACQMCEAHVNEAIRKAFAVKKVTSSFKKKQTEIISEHLLSEEKLHEALDPTGYRILGVHTQPYEKKGWLF